MIRKGFSLVAITALASLCTASYGEDGSVYNSLNGTASGQIRMFYIDRDYELIEKRLKQIGADIKRVKEN